MKKTILLLLALLGILLSSEKQFAQTIWSLDFETTGGYTTSEPEFTNGFYDYFLRTDGSDIGTSVSFNGVLGSYYFAGQDINAQATLPVYLNVDDIDISGQTDLQFRVYLAEDDDGTNQDWDEPDYVHFYYDVDNSGTFTNLLWLENDGSTYNSAPFIDTNFDGTGDGTEITDTFVQFVIPLPVSGSLIDIKIEFSLDSGDEDIAIDQLEIVVGGGPLPLNANFNADQTNVLTGTTVNFTDLTTGGTIPYSYEWDLDGDGTFDDAFVANPSFMYNTPGTYDVSLRVTDDDTSVDTETKTGYITVITPIEVANLAALRAGIQGEVYKVTGEVILTYQQSFRNQKYIEDATAAILIDDNPGIIITTYDLYDSITNIVGTLGEYGNMLQCAPFTDPGAATSTGNTITPQVVTIDDLNNAFDDYEAELVQLLDVSFTDAGGIFETDPAQVYEISDASKAFGNFRTTFYDVDYIGTTIPATADIVVLPNARTDGNYVTSRSLADIEAESNPATQLAVVSVNGGADPYVSTDFNVVVQAQDEFGDPAIVDIDIEFTFSTNGGDLGTVQFVGGTTTGGIIGIGTSQVTVTGVQMAPAGTNVTITAEDNPFGLISGTSGPFDVIELVIPDLIICEIMPDPVAVDDAVGEWFEIYNYGATDVDLLGFVIKDNDFDSTTIDMSVNVPAGGFAVLGRNSDPLVNGDYTCDYQYSGFSLGNTADEVILTIADGMTEIDRVEYDGGTVWPDPTGTSMTFHGFPTDNNNDGTNWTYATFREASYVGITGDRGTPGTNGYDQILTGGFKLDLKVLLEGPYNIVNDSMTNDLNAKGFIPAEQPYNPALPYYGNNNPVWLYGGTETTSYFPYYGTDWLMVELRDAASAGAAGNGTMIAQYPAYLMVDGRIVSLNGATPININISYSNSLYVVIWQRNHLGIMIPSGLNPVDGTIESYDFTTGSGQVYNGSTGYTELEPGIWGMVTGDVNADGTVDGNDKADGWSTDTGKSGYLGGDLNLNGQSNNNDKNDFWLLNDGTNSQVPN